MRFGSVNQLGCGPKSVRECRTYNRGKNSREELNLKKEEFEGASNGQEMLSTSKGYKSVREINIRKNREKSIQVEGESTTIIEFK